MQFKALWLGFLPVMWITVASAADQTRTLTAVQDTSIFNGTASSDTLADGSGDFLWLSVTAEGLNRRALLKFDVSGIPPGSVVKQATLTLYESRARDEHNVSLHRLLGSWGEGASNAGGSGSGVPAQTGDATWLHRFFPGTLWTTPGGDFDPNASAVQRVGLPNTTYSWTAITPPPPAAVPRLVQDVQAWVNNPGVNHGWIMLGQDGFQNAKRFESRNNAAVVNRPQLRLVYTEPVPPVDEADIPVPPWAVALLGALVWGLRMRHKDMRHTDHARRSSGTSRRHSDSP